MRHHDVRWVLRRVHRKLPLFNNQLLVWRECSALLCLRGGAKLHERHLWLAWGSPPSGRPFVQSPRKRRVQVERFSLEADQRVMLSHDLADHYDVPTKALVRAVKRNIKRFPPDFMFQLSAEETAVSRYQFGTLKNGSNPYLAPSEG
jgi:hypothetical protein